jgi:hypothetical protein
MAGIGLCPCMDQTVNIVIIQKYRELPLPQEHGTIESSPIARHAIETKW